jgi:hypothetical protein
MLGVKIVSCRLAAWGAFGASRSDEYRRASLISAFPAVRMVVAMAMPGTAAVVAVAVAIA